MICIFNATETALYFVGNNFGKLKLHKAMSQKPNDAKKRGALWSLMIHNHINAKHDTKD